MGPSRRSRPQLARLGGLWHSTWGSRRELRQTRKRKKAVQTVITPGIGFSPLDRLLLIPIILLLKLGIVQRSAARPIAPSHACCQLVHDITHWPHAPQNTRPSPRCLSGATTTLNALASLIAVPSSSYSPVSASFLH